MNETRQTREGIRIHEPQDFHGMHAAGRIAAQILDEVGPLVVPGTTTGAIDDYIRNRVTELGTVSATIGYRGYQHASCISVNHVVCHGIPGDKILSDGDILNIDVTVIADGWYGDSSRMYVAGKPSAKAKRLIQVTHDSLMKGIEAVRPGATFGDIGHAIQSYVEDQRMSVVRDFCGHGLGRTFHAPPNVLHFGRPGKGAVLEEGMFFTIEPMVNLGRPETKVLADDWTAVTRDRSLSAQFEHSVGVTETGVPETAGDGVDGVRGHHGLPLGPLGVADHDRDRRAQRLAVPDAGEERHLVGLELHARPATGAQPTPGQRLGEVAGAQPNVRRNALDGGHQGTSVRLACGQVTQHGSECFTRRRGVRVLPVRQTSTPRPAHPCL